MRKRLLMAAMLAVVIVILSGCGSGKGINDSDDKIVSGLTRYNLNDSNYFYIVDDRTGVVYLQYSAGYKGWAVVMVNPDGTPVTVDQLDIGTIIDFR